MFSSPVHPASSSQLRRSHRVSRGFTLLEILVVLAIIGLLVGLAVGRVEGIFGGNQEKIASIFVQSSLKTPLMAYRLDMGDYPTTAEGLQALITAPGNKAGSWKGPYLEAPNGRLPVDPWGEPYQYRYPGTRNKTGYDVWSKGGDKQDGTADDVGNWSSTEAAAQK